MEVSEEVDIKYHVIIDSIGKANPGASKILSDVFGTPVEVVAKALYNTPSVLFSNVEEKLAHQCLELLGKLGMEGHMQDVTEPLPEKQSPVDVAVYVEDVSKLSEITTSLSGYLGCSFQEALNLLMTDPGFVLGGVSMSAAQALCDRLDTEVIISDPKKDLYTLAIDREKATENHLMYHKLKGHLEYTGLLTAGNKEDVWEFVNLTYEKAQEVWKKFQSSGMLKIINQSFQRFEINLVAVDDSIGNYRKALNEEIGMPDDVIDVVLENLPVQIISSANGKVVSDKITAFKKNGLSCSARLIKPNNYKLLIESIEDLNLTREILSKFLEEEQLPVGKGAWEFPKPLGDLMYRYLDYQLSAAGCEVDYEDFN